MNSVYLSRILPATTALSSSSVSKVEHIEVYRKTHWKLISKIISRDQCKAMYLHFSTANAVGAGFVILNGLSAQIQFENLSRLVTSASISYQRIILGMGSVNESSD